MFVTGVMSFKEALRAPVSESESFFHFIQQIPLWVSSCVYPEKRKSRDQAAYTAE